MWAICILFIYSCDFEIVNRIAGPSGSVTKILIDLLIWFVYWFRKKLLLLEKSHCIPNMEFGSNIDIPNTLIDKTARYTKIHIYVLCSLVIYIWTIRLNNVGNNILSWNMLEFRVKYLDRSNEVFMIRRFSVLTNFKICNG